jgi:hypothetical protein
VLFVNYDPLRDNAISHPVGSDRNDADHEQSPAVSRSLEVVHVTGLRVGVLEGLLDLLAFELHEWVVLVPVGVILSEDPRGFVDLAFLPEPLGTGQLCRGHKHPNQTYPRGLRHVEGH